MYIYMCVYTYYVCVYVCICVYIGMDRLPKDEYCKSPAASCTAQGPQKRSQILKMDLQDLGTKSKK